MASRKATNPAKPVELRMAAVRCFLDGTPGRNVAAYFGVSRATITNWVRWYREHGEEGLHELQRGPERGEGGLLEEYEMNMLRDMITDKCPEQLKLDFYLWTREAIKDLVWETFGVHVALRTISTWLADWGMTAQVPSKHATEADSEEVRVWLETTYPAIRERAGREGAEICWGDETGLSSKPNVGKGFSPKGKTPVAKMTGSRFGINIITAISNLGNLRFKCFEGKFNTEVFIDFLGRLCKGSSRKIFLIVDNHSVHTSKAVVEWLKGREDKIELFFIPKYSPQLNPPEYLNQDLKANVLKRKRAKNRGELAKIVEGFLLRKKRDKGCVARYFQAAMVKYAA